MDALIQPMTNSPAATSPASRVAFEPQDFPSLPNSQIVSSPPRNATHRVPKNSPHSTHARNQKHPFPRNLIVSPKKKLNQEPTLVNSAPLHGETSGCSQASAQSPTTPQSSDASKEHSTNSKRSHKNQAAKDGENSKKEPNSTRIEVSGFPKYTQPQDLTLAFSKFGKVTIDRICNTFAVISYPTAEEADAAVKASKKVNVYGEFLTVISHKPGKSKPHKNKLEFPRSKEKGTVVDPKQIDLSGDFYDQLDKILATIRLTQEEVERIGLLYEDVQEALQDAWPGCVAMPFGSIVFGLGIKSSDADCFVDLPHQYRHYQGNVVHRAKRELSRYPHVFSEIFSIPRANTPIVKLFHIPTEINCDLSFKTLLGVQNSKLISYLLRIDPKLIPLCVVIKYWAKVHGLTGTGRLSNYALTLLVIFYLQQPSLRIVPSVECIQKDPESKFIVDFWNTGFTTYVPPVLGEKRIPELLGGFFEYYSMFNFDEMVICPYLGVPIKKELFRDLNQLPEEFARYKHNVVSGNCYPMRLTTSMCIQDPIEQCHNVGCSISNRLAMEIKAYFQFAAVNYEKDKANNLEEFLKVILLQKPKFVREKTNPEYRVHLFPKIIANIITPDWKSVVRDLVFTVFEKMLKLKLGKMEEKVTPNARKQKEKYTGTITKLIWKRKQFNRVYHNFKYNLEEKESKITEEILNVDKNKIKLDFQLTITFKNDPKSGMLGIKLVNGNVESFQEFGKFFISVTQQWFVNLLRPHVKNSENNVAAKIAETLEVRDENMAKHVDDLDRDDNVRNDKLISDHFDDNEGTNADVNDEVTITVDDKNINVKNNGINNIETNNEVKAK